MQSRCRFIWIIYHYLLHLQAAVVRIVKCQSETPRQQQQQQQQRHQHQTSKDSDEMTSLARTVTITTTASAITTTSNDFTNSSITAAIDKISLTTPTTGNSSTATTSSENTTVTVTFRNENRGVKVNSIPLKEQSQHSTNNIEYEIPVFEPLADLPDQDDMPNDTTTNDIANITPIDLKDISAKQDDILKTLKTVLANQERLSEAIKSLQQPSGNDYTPTFFKTLSRFPQIMTQSTPNSCTTHFSYASNPQDTEIVLPQNENTPSPNISLQPSITFP